MRLKGKSMKVEKGTVIDEETCMGCGATVPVKVNKAGGVYFFCARVVGTNPDTGKPERCYTRLNIGRTGSERIINEYLENKKDIENGIDRHEHEVVTEEEPEPAGIGHNGGPPLDDEPAAEPKRKRKLESWFS